MTRNILEKVKNDVIERAEKELHTLRPNEVIELFVSGWIIRKEDGERVGIWYSFSKQTLDEYIEMVREKVEFLDLYAKSLTPTKILILLKAYDGASESELAEFVGLKGGALHYHLRDLIYLGLLKRTSRGFYETTKYGSFVIRTAVSAIRKFERSLEKEDKMY